MNTIRKLPRWGKKPLLVLLGLLLCSKITEGAPNPWWNNSFHFRVPVTVTTGLLETRDPVVTTSINFSRIFSDLKVQGMPDEFSVRVVEAQTANDRGREIPCAFHKDAGYDARSHAVGNVSWKMEGTIPALEEKLYYVYFDILENGHKKAPSYPGETIAPGDKATPNLVENPGAENPDKDNPLSPDLWTNQYFPSLAVRSDEEAHSGKYSFKITTKKGLLGDGAAWCSPFMKLRPGKTYAFSFWAREKEVPAGEQGAPMTAFLYFFDENKNVVSQNCAVNRWGPGSYPKDPEGKFAFNRWLFLTMTRVTPAGTCYGIIHAFPYGDPVTVYFDDFEIREVVTELPLPTITVGKAERQ